MKGPQPPVSALVFVHIPTHFSEMVRVVELLERSGRYRPVVMFAAMYAGVERDIERCKTLGATVITEPELHIYSRATLAAQRQRKRTRLSLHALQNSMRHVATKVKQWDMSASRWVDQRFSDAGAALHSVEQASTAGVRLIGVRLKGLGAAVKNAALRVPSLTRQVLARAAANLHQLPAVGRQAVNTVLPFLPAWVVKILIQTKRHLVGNVLPALRPLWLVPLRAIWRIQLQASRAARHMAAHAVMRTLGLVGQALQLCVYLLQRLIKGLLVASGRLLALLAWLMQTGVVGIRGFVRLLSNVTARAIQCKRHFSHRIEALIAAAKTRLRTVARDLFRWGWRWLNAPTPYARLREAKPRPRDLFLCLLLAPVAVLAALLRLLVYPLRGPLRRLAVALFGVWYQQFSTYLPPDIRALQYIQWALPGLLDAHDIRLLVLPEDNFYYFTNFYVKAVHDRGGAAIVVPFTIVNMLEWAEAFYKEPSHNADLLLNSAMAFLFPRWRHSHRGRSLVMPFQQILCTEYFGTAPPVPWLINSGHADAIAVESAFMYKYYLRAGIEEKRLRLTGALYDDALHHARIHADVLRENLYRRLRLTPGRPMLLCALPPNQLAGAGRATCDFSDYAKLLEAFVQPLRGLVDTYNCVLSLHPRIDSNSLAALDLGLIRVATENVASLIPLSHLYIASCSATIRLAINCGVPVVNYDVYRYDYDDYKGIPGVLTTEENAAYQQAVLRLCTEPQVYADSQRQLQAFAAEHAVLDGQAGDRLCAIMDALLPKPRCRACQQAKCG